tara:strand:- start:167 stop:514 length:348 start_codon:yes stop_codon:yes gene_type:complete
MKLRIKGNSVRLRLTQSEVDSIGSGNSVEESTDFAGKTLKYRLLVAEDYGARFEDYTISINLKEEVIQSWLKPEEVSIRFDVGNTGYLVEKDFACLITRDGEDDADTFPNPLAKI